MRVLLAALLVSLAPISAFADSKPPPDVGQMATDDCAKARKAKKDCVLKMEGHEVSGGSAKGTGSTVTVLPGTKHGSLIRVRRDFIQEILKTAEDL
jgi:hypothetical protein